ncbi:CD209 antigen-like protein E isoform X1 [Podarcis raffonei]|uniref:CD209 antigen-like protein E isoform X1 n=1 Tax=Podarcis raffonei TaxID=65483 RepID=UPI0023296C68|nr:CD209 antigen-like protein E isoform X1 [Podarcis raffonei]
MAPKNPPDPAPKKDAATPAEDKSFFKTPCDEAVVVFFFFLLFLASVMMAGLYCTLWAEQRSFFSGVKQIWNFVEEYDPSSVGMDDLEILAVAQGLADELLNSTLLNDEIKSDIDKIAELLKDPQWKMHNRALYYFSNEKQSWEESRKHCIKKKTSLISVSNGEEQDFINNEGAKFKKHFWIGLRKNNKKLNGLEWLDGSAVLEVFWDTEMKQPSTSPDENCVYITQKCRHRYCWHDSACWHKMSFICKKAPDQKWER